MTLNMFLTQCEEAFGGKTYTLGQKAAFTEKCSRFTERELNRIYSDLLETSKYLPKIADVYDAARSMGMLDTEERPVHRWDATDCGLCRGEGRLMIVWHCFRELQGDRLKEIEELTQLMPYSQGLDYKQKPNEYRSIFRCRCLAGDALTIPKSFPKWSKSSETRRERWA